MLVGRREIRDWRVEQGIFYSESGGKFARVRAPVADAPIAGDPAWGPGTRPT